MTPEAFYSVLLFLLAAALADLLVSVRTEVAAAMRETLLAWARLMAAAAKPPERKPALPLVEEGE